MMNTDKPEECTVCYENYEEATRRPRTLPCGHTFCSDCIENAIENDRLPCPNCRAPHRALSALQFPISYCVEALIRKLKDTQRMSAGSTSTKRRVDCSRSTSKKLRSLAQEQKKCMMSLVTDCDEVLTQLSEYQGQLSDWTTHHHQLHDRLCDLVEQNKGAIKLLEQENTSVVDMVKEGVEGKSQLQVLLGNMDESDTGESIASMERANQCNVEVIEDWLQKCHDKFPNVNTVRTLVKVQESIREAPIVTKAGASATTIPVGGDPASTIMERVRNISKGIFLVTVEHLRRMSDPVKTLVETGQVFAVQSHQDELSSSRISSQDGQLYLHTLLCQPPPALACTLQYKDVVGMLDSSSTLAFLDLEWPGSTRRRVHIRLNCNTGLAKQFVLLCTGQRGSTYANTILTEVLDKGNSGERVEGGDYECNDGEGGAPLLSDLQGEYWESGSAGTVWSPWLLGSPQSAQFCISTRDRTGGLQWPQVFGEVVSGLDVMRAAANQTDIRQVTVVDCGVVLPL
ncbi:uncharacterized protein [Procambarus clarkii]|uniref:uncharacterized protein n=1 Tax=Procambarus clarkii TaxID=6728 RepID=UPI001E6743D6|nr:uncharacterized protein LOC123772619 [Procambarus clarkii]XP_045621824.1 uncharacterized protein LOC123772619 [Procambarus clarkii]XP_045621825.1 uncharacterized protein LOC123772619 [Procambarus clarkii]